MLNHLKKNWKTTVLGLATLAFTAAKVAMNPVAIANPETLAEISAGVGLLAAKDSDKTGTAHNQR